MVSETTKLRYKRKAQRAVSTAGAAGKVAARLAKKRAKRSASAVGSELSSIKRKAMSALGMGPNKKVPSKKVKGSGKDKDKPVGRKMRMKVKMGKAAQRKATTRGRNY